MKKNALIILFALFIYSLSAQKTQLTFNDAGTFKIAQFTDLHFSFDSQKSDSTLAMITTVVKAEKPDLILLTGDVVTDIPAREGWDKLSGTLERLGTPWGITLGNHDDEPSIGRDEIFKLLAHKPYFIGQQGPHITGYGNYVLTISGSQSDKAAAAIYCMDSNGFGKISKLSGYEWFRFDQIEWYRNQSNSLTNANHGQPLPSVAFFHIPLPEYKELGDKVLGNQWGKVSSPDINSGMFASMIEQNDILGIFVGHDHNNDYVGRHKDIVLGYGRVSGSDASGKLERGGRMIVLYENQYRFDTWISTPSGREFEYAFPSNQIVEDETTVTYLPAQSVNPQQKGLRYAYYLGSFKKSLDVLHAQPVKTGIASTISLEPSSVRDSFALLFEGYIQIPEKGVYSFYTRSDDGSCLYIDDQLVVDNDGPHATRRRDGIIGLEKGFHKIQLIYFESYWGEHLEAGFSSKNLRESLIPAYLLYTD